MPDPSCPGCRELERRVQELEALVRELLAKLNTNATNSSTPPSANPLGADKPVKKEKSQRQRGGQPDHPPHLKQLLPTERVTQTEHFYPQACARCHAELPRAARAGDPEPKRFQTVDIPPVPVEVVEYQAHGRTCACCGHATHATIPAAIRAHSVGPRLTATLAYFTGCHGISKRGVEEIVETVFGVSISLGTVANLEQEVSAALAPAHQEAIAAVRQANVKFADETSWKLWGKLCWLWAAATSNIAVFVIHAQRGAVGLAALLGEEIDGILHSDRWHVYLQVPAERRQLCWAHLKRDFQKVLDSGGPSEGVGRRGLRIVKEVFAAWHRFQKGQVTRRTLHKVMEP
jgi:transposase